LVEQILRNWVKATEKGKLDPPGGEGGETGKHGTVAPAGGECARLRMECETLKKRWRTSRKTRWYAWRGAAEGLPAVPAMRAALGTSLDSYQAYQAWKRGGVPKRERLTDARPAVPVRALHAEFKGTYGSTRIAEEIRVRSHPAGKERAERLMRENGIRARDKRRFNATTVRSTACLRYRARWTEISRRRRQIQSGGPI
jgi:hypothetical protein